MYKIKNNFFIDLKQEIFPWNIYLAGIALYLYAQKLVLTAGEEGGVGDTSLKAGETCVGVKESTEALSSTASSESP